MSREAVDALRAERDEVLTLARSLSPEEWASPSDCDGWRVQDVIAHMTTGMRQVVDPTSVPVGDSPDVEQDTGARTLALGGDGAIAATITSSTRDFVVGGTQRRSWRDFDVTIDGDTELGAAVADTINVI